MNSKKQTKPDVISQFGTTITILNLKMTTSNIPLTQLNLMFQTYTKRLITIALNQKIVYRFIVKYIVQQFVLIIDHFYAHSVPFHRQNLK